MNIRKLLGIVAGLSIGVPALFTSCSCVKVQGKGKMTLGPSTMPWVEVKADIANFEVTSPPVDDVAKAVKRIFEGWLMPLDLPIVPTTPDP